MSAFLAHADYYATGSVDLFATYEARLYGRTQVALIDGTGPFFLSFFVSAFYSASVCSCFFYPHNVSAAVGIVVLFGKMWTIS